MSPIFDEVPKPKTAALRNGSGGFAFGAFLRFSGLFFFSHHPIAGILTLMAAYTITDGTDTFTGVYEDNSALSGEYFGFRIAKNSGSGSVVSAALDNFSLDVIPEPSSFALLAAAGLFAAGRRSRR